MNFRSSRSNTLKTSFAQLDDFLLNQAVPGNLSEILLLHEIERHYSWLQCVNVALRPEGNINPYRKSNVVNKEDSKKRSRAILYNDDEDVEDEFSSGSIHEYKGYKRNNDIRKKTKTPSIKVNLQRIPTDDEYLLQLNSMYEISEDERLYDREKAARSVNSDYGGIDIYKLIHKDSKLKSRKDNSNSNYIHEVNFNGNGNYFKKVAFILMDIKPEKNELFDFKETTRIFKERLPLYRKKALAYKKPLPEDIYCPGIMDNFVDKLSLIDNKTYIDVINNDFEEKLKGFNNKYTINGTLISYNEIVAKKYEFYNKSTDPYIRASTEPFETEKYGLGLRAVRNFHQSNFICEYTGELLTYKEFLDKSIIEDYTFHFVDGLVIDSSKKGSLARFINHSIKPNCYLQIFLVLDENNYTPKFGIFAKSYIEAGEELTLDYNDNNVYNIKPKRCYCGKENCSGFIRDFHHKLNLINFSEFDTMYHENEQKIGDITNIRNLINSRTGTNYSQRKLKKLSVLCSVPTNKDLHESFFFVVGSNMEYLKKKKAQELAAEEHELKLRDNDKRSDKTNPRSRIPASNGSLEFEALPNKLKKQLGIDMVMEELT